MPGMNRDKVLRLAKGFRGRGKSCIRTARLRVEKALEHAYRDRRVKKRNFRMLWIAQINAATRQKDLSYSRFINALVALDIRVDRKILAELAQNEPVSFHALTTLAKEHIAKETSVQQHQINTSTMSRLSRPIATFD
jgi:large subunit ribosomal protein L20